MKNIPIYIGDNVVAQAIVDDKNFDRLNTYKWYLHTKGYAYTSINGSLVFMHRFILGLEKGDKRQGDHINRNKLDHQESNLRILASQAEQMQNKGVDRNNKSGYRGVTWDSTRGKWRANVMLNGKQKFLGYFTDPAEAGKVAAEYRKEHMPFYID